MRNRVFIRSLTAVAAMVGLWVFSAGAAWAQAIETSEVRYAAGSVTAHGYLALPATGDDHPGVLVVHEWWGHNAYARQRAEQLAALGFAALAVDMYGGGATAAHPEDAGKFASAVRSNLDEGMERFEGAVEFLRGQDRVDDDRIAAIGYGFGGSVVLQAALAGVDNLDGVASFHGSLGGLVYPEDGDDIEARVRVYNGAADSFVSAEHIAEFKGQMERLDADTVFVNYEGALHSFTNPAADEYAQKFNMPVGYNAEADQKSWVDLQTFLNELFAEEIDD